MSVIEDANLLLNKHYGVSISIEGLKETLEEMLRAEETSPDEMFKMLLQAQQWSIYLDRTKEIVRYYMGFFDIKHSMIGAVRDEAKDDIKKDQKNSAILAARCKIDETEPSKILEASEWMLKTSKEEIKILKRLIAELDSYSKMMKAKYFSFSRKYKISLQNS